MPDIFYSNLGVKDMKKLLLTFLMVAVCFGLAQVSTGEDVGISITASPKTLVFDFEDGAVEDDLVTVTVHTNVPYYLVDNDSVELDTGDGSSISAFSTFADDRGNLVAKFRVYHSELVIDDKQAELTLFGDYKDSENSFSGSDTVYVVIKNDGGPEKNPGPGPGGSGN